MVLSVLLIQAMKIGCSDAERSRIHNLSGEHDCVTLSYMSTLTIRVPDALKRELEHFSKQRGQTSGDIVRESLKRYLAVERFQALRGKTLPFAEAQGFLTDEDVFKALS